MLIVMFLILEIMIFPPEAHAYLDPGSGSYFFQMLVGIIFGALVGIKLFWKNIRNFLLHCLARFRNLFNGKKGI